LVQFVESKLPLADPRGEVSGVSHTRSFRGGSLTVSDSPIPEKGSGSPVTPSYGFAVSLARLR
ncbi:hypothetical protein C5B91_21380, partial [Haloferax sp. Atlit-10N]|uniref:hypothetical protein n=1 Tax=Haloferax sp. Atlit-10N TaxID=2077204 RepID=UPI000E390D8D